MGFEIDKGGGRLIFSPLEGDFLLMELPLPLIWSCPLKWKKEKKKEKSESPQRDLLFLAPGSVLVQADRSSRPGVLVGAVLVNSGPVASPSLLRKYPTALLSRPAFACLWLHLFFSPIRSFLRDYFGWEECRHGLSVVRDFDSVWRSYNVFRCC